MERTDLQGVDDIKKLIELRQEYFKVHNHIVTVHKLLVLMETMLRDYFSAYSIRKEKVTSGSCFSFLRHSGNSGELAALRDYDIPIRIFYNLLEKEQDRLSKLMSISFKQYAAHKELYNRLLFRDKDGDSVLDDNHYLVPIYNMDDIERLEYWADEHTEDEVLHTSSDELLFGEFLELFPAIPDENTSPADENVLTENN